MTATIARLTTAVLWSLAVVLVPSAEGQPAGKAWRVGILATANPRVYDDVIDELRKLG